MKKILVPTDFSENAANALVYAIQLVKLVNGKLILFHNADFPLNYTGTNIFPGGDLGMGIDPAYPAGVLNNPELEHIQQERINQLATRVRQDTGNTIPVKTFYKYGSFTDNLSEVIREEQADLVVMGTHGASTFLDRLVGTNTASVIKNSLVPVLAIPAEARFKPIKHIAYAVDLESDEDIFLDQLIAFAKPFGAIITLVHIKTENQPDKITDRMLLKELRTRYPGQYLQMTERQGKTVAQGLEEFIIESGSDLLAIGIHKHGFFHSVFHSTVPEQLVFHNTVPVVALPEIQMKAS
jgi:nucleotide-binding universal stress UspA family protein